MARPMACGDFNARRKREEKNGSSFNVSVSRGFNRLIKDLNLIEIKLNGQKYTWYNLRDIASMALLDRFLCSTDWEGKFPNSFVKVLPIYQSDHNPLVMGTNSSQNNSKRNCRFEKVYAYLMRKVGKIGTIGHYGLVLTWVGKWSEVQTTSLVRRKQLFEWVDNEDGIEVPEAPNYSCYFITGMLLLVAASAARCSKCFSPW